MSTKPAASSRTRVASGVSKWAGPSQPSPIVARTAMIDAMFPRRRIGRRAGRPGGGPRRGSGTARRGRGPSGTWRSTGSRRRACRVAAAGPGRRPRSRPGHRTGPAAGAPRRSSTASRPARRPCRTAAARGARSVTRPEPQPASRTCSSPASDQAVEDRLAPAGHRIGDPVVGRGVPVAGHRDRPGLTGIREIRSIAAFQVVSRKPVGTVAGTDIATSSSKT